MLKNQIRIKWFGVSRFEFFFNLEQKHGKNDQKNDLR